MPRDLGSLGPVSSVQKVEHVVRVADLPEVLALAHAARDLIDLAPEWHRDDMELRPVRDQDFGALARAIEPLLPGPEPTT